MEDNGELTEVTPIISKRGRHPKNCQCPTHLALLRPKETKSITIRNGRNTEVLDQKGEVLDADNITFITDDPTSSRFRIAQWIDIKSKDPNLKRKEIAHQIGMTDRGLEALIYRATKEGWLRFSNPLERLENEIIPKTLDNLSTFLNEKDKTATIEVAKGTIFKHYQEAKGIVDKPTTILALKIETVNPDQVKVISSSIVGRPRVIDAEVEEDAI